MQTGQNVACIRASCTLTESTTASTSGTSSATQGVAGDNPYEVAEILQILRSAGLTQESLGTSPLDRRAPERQHRVE